MSVLIKDMKMPNCYNCTLESICSRWAKHDVEWQKQNRDEDCPLVEIPAQHGRLIDADALNDMINRSYTMTDRVDVHNGYAICQEMIKQLPTIIEAERRVT